ncbi:MAG: Holliday junction resolvase RuvX [Candidatus Omnitrophota bacterium]
MRTLALDVGSKRIGLAISDALGITAQGLETIERGDEHALENIIKERDVSEIVIGLPLNMDGTKGERAQDAILFAESLKNKFSMPVKMWDERLSTLHAEREMIRGDLSRKKRKRLNDMLAAQLILQNYMDAKKSRMAED